MKNSQVCAQVIHKKTKRLHQPSSEALLVRKKMKICTKCKKSKKDSAFYRHKRDGYNRWCKDCCRQWKQENVGKMRAYRRKNYQIHGLTDAHKERQRIYQQSMPGYMKTLWRGMVKRCNNPKDKAYKYYGGRGISVKFTNFENFYNYVVNELRADPRGLTIDRIDNDGHYERGNIRFVTQAENNRNKAGKELKDG